jgi:hypothetical protein
MSNGAKRNLIAKYKRLLATMLSDEDMEYYIGGSKAKILKYSELANYNDLAELLPDKKDYRIILTESKRNQGHWCCLLKYPSKNGSTIEWFDSYGTKPDGELRFIPIEIRRMLGETEHQLTRLFKTAAPRDKVIYNKKKLQSLDDDVNTCGRWSVARIFMNQMGYDLEDFIDKIEGLSEDSGKPYDIIVCDLVQ